MYAHYACGNGIVKRGGTYLDEAVGGSTIPEIGYSESAATLYLADAHGELGNGTLADAVIGGVELCGVDCDGGDAGEEVEKEAERDAEGEAVPELCYGVG